MLAWMLSEGEWLPPDAAEALRWTRAAAEQGIARAQARLGTMYHDAQGVARDMALAVHWWRKAAIQGDPDAQARLGAALHTGQGIPADQVEALVWLTRAMSGGSALAANFLGRVRAQLTPEAAIHAERRARERPA
jgi:TPR repeat protein